MNYFTGKKPSNVLIINSTTVTYTYAFRNRSACSIYYRKIVLLTYQIQEGDNDFTRNTHTQKHTQTHK